MLLLAIAWFVLLAYWAHARTTLNLIEHARDGWFAITRDVFWQEVKRDLRRTATDDVCAPGTMHPVFRETGIRPDAPNYTARLLDGLTIEGTTQLAWRDIEMFARARECTAVYEDPVTDEGHIVRASWMVWVDEANRHWAHPRLTFEPEHWTEYGRALEASRGVEGAGEAPGAGGQA